MLQIFKAERTRNEDTYDPILTPLVLKAKIHDIDWEPMGYSRVSTGLGGQTRFVSWEEFTNWLTPETPVNPFDSSRNPVELGTWSLTDVIIRSHWDSQISPRTSYWHFTPTSSLLQVSCLPPNMQTRFVSKFFKVRTPWAIVRKHCPSPPG